MAYPTVERYANNSSTTLSAAITDINATTIYVTSASSFPPAGSFRIQIESELMRVTAVSGTTWTVVRGVEGTTKATHINGSTVDQVLTATGVLGAQGVHDVRLYGAVGDGSTDDTAAIQAAIDAVSNGYGGTVYIPDGVWKITGSGLTIGGNNITIKGSGGQATELLYTGTTGSCIRNSATGTTRWDTAIEDLWIYSETLTTGDLILVQNFHRLHGRNLRLQCNWATGGNCLHIVGASAWSTYFSFWSDCVFEGGTNCVLIDGEGTANGHTFQNFTMRGGGSTSPSGLVSRPTTYAQGSIRLIAGSIEGCTGTYGALTFGNNGAATMDSFAYGVNIESSNGSVAIGQNCYYNTIDWLSIDNASGSPTFYSASERDLNYIAYLEVTDAVNNQPMSMNGGYSRPGGLRFPLDASPWTAEDGRCYYDTATHKLMIYDGAGYRYLLTT